jgi:serine/threonine-protein kinase HipA
MNARRIEVRYLGQPVGQLATNGRQTLFQYDAGWLRTGHDLAPFTMKRRNEPTLGIIPEFHYLPPLFAGSLPDDYGRRIMTAWFRKHRGPAYTPTPLDMLGYVGETGMGALTYHPTANAFPAAIYRALDIRSQQKLSEAIDSPGLSDGEFVEQARRAAHTVGGMYPKFLCAEDRRDGKLYEDDPRVGRGFRRWIVKLSQDTRPYAGEIEFLLNRLAKTAGISVPETKLMVSRDKNGVETANFAIERFDSIEDERIHVSSLAVLLGRPASGLDIDYRDLLRTSHELTRDASQVEEAFRRMVFNVAVCNTDDHAKNHAFLYREGKWTLSPAFDVNFDPGTPGQEANHAMPIFGTSNSIGSSHLITAGEHFGISRCRAMANEVLEAVSEVRNCSKAQGLDVRPIASALETLELRSSALRPPRRAPLKKKQVSRKKTKS